MRAITGFFRGVVREMRKTSFPKRGELMKYSLTVFVMVTIMIVFFFSIDIGISRLLDFVLG